MRWALATLVVATTSATDAGLCQETRLCAFQSIELFQQAQRVAFDVTGFSPACGNLSVCTPSQSSTVARLLAEAAANASVYGNNRVCRNPMAMEIMTFDTLDLPCDGVTRMAQTLLIRLCGTLNGRSCNGQCTSLDQTSPRAALCHQTTDAGTKGVTVGILFVVQVALWAMSPETKLASRKQTLSTDAYMRVNYT